MLKMFLDFEADPLVRLPENAGRLPDNVGRDLLPASLSSRLSELLRRNPRVGSWNNSLRNATDGLLVRSSSLVFAFDERHHGQSVVSRKVDHDTRSHGPDRYPSVAGIG